MKPIHHVAGLALFCSIVGCGSSNFDSSNSGAGNANSSSSDTPTTTVPDSTTTTAGSGAVFSGPTAACSISGSPDLYAFYMLQNSAGPGTPPGQQTLAFVFSSDPNYCISYDQGVLPNSTVYTAVATPGTTTLVNAQIAADVTEQIVAGSGQQCLSLRPASPDNSGTANVMLTSQAASDGQMLNVTIDVAQQGNTPAYTLQGTATNCSASSYPSVGGSADSSNGYVPCRTTPGGSNTAELYPFYMLRNSSGPNTPSGQQTLAILFSSDPNYCAEIGSGILADSALYTIITPQGTNTLSNTRLQVNMSEQVIASSGTQCLAFRPEAGNITGALTSTVAEPGQSLNVTISVAEQPNSAALMLQGLATNCSNSPYPTIGGSIDSGNGYMGCRQD